MNPEHHLARLRAILSKPADREVWTALLKLLEESSWEGDWSLVGSYLCQHLSRWPDDLRAFPIYSEFWQKHLQQTPDHPLFRIFVFAQMLSPKHIQEESLQVLLRLPNLRCVRIELKDNEPVTYSPSFLRVLNRVRELQIRNHTLSLEEQTQLFEACDPRGWETLEIAYPMHTFESDAVGRFLARLSALPMQKLRSFRLAGYPLTREALRLWFWSADWPSLQDLQIRHAGLTQREAHTLIDGPFAASLQRLDLSYNRLSDDGLLRLAQWSQPNLTRLSLAANGLGDHGLAQALSSPLLTSVRDLDLRFNDLSDDSVQRMITLFPETRWERLQLHFNPIRASALAALQDAAQRLGRDIDLAPPPPTASFVFYQDALRSEPFFALREPTSGDSASLSSLFSDLPYLSPLMLGLRAERSVCWEIDTASATHVGHLRQHNEDIAMGWPHSQVFVVADGMGGGSSGDLASGFLIRFLARGFGADELPPLWVDLSRGLLWADTLRPFHLPNTQATALLLLLHEANLALFRCSSGAEGRPSLRGCGATFAALAIEGTHAWVAHAGDCRAYLSREGKLYRLTEDHTLLQECLRMGLLRSPQDVQDFPHKNVIVRALGYSGTLDIQIACFPIQSDDLFLLCTDGVHNELSSEALSAFFNTHQGTAQQIAQAFLARILQEPCRDNIAFQLVHVRKE